MRLLASNISEGWSWTRLDLQYRPSQIFFPTVVWMDQLTSRRPSVYLRSQTCPRTPNDMEPPTVGAGGKVKPRASCSRYAIAWPSKPMQPSHWNLNKGLSKLGMNPNNADVTSLDVSYTCISEIGYVGTYDTHTLIHH